jgi:hypothetical protein
MYSVTAHQMRRTRQEERRLKLWPRESWDFQMARDLLILMRNTHNVVLGHCTLLPTVLYHFSPRYE